MAQHKVKGSLLNDIKSRVSNERVKNNRLLRVKIVYKKLNGDIDIKSWSIIGYKNIEIPTPPAPPPISDPIITKDVSIGYNQTFSINLSQLGVKVIRIKSTSVFPPEKNLRIYTLQGRKSILDNIEQYIVGTGFIPKPPAPPTPEPISPPKTYVKYAVMHRLGVKNIILPEEIKQELEQKYNVVIERGLFSPEQSKLNLIKYLFKITGTNESATEQCAREIEKHVVITPLIAPTPAPLTTPTTLTKTQTTQTTLLQKEKKLKSKPEVMLRNIGTPAPRFRKLIGGNYGN